MPNSFSSGVQGMGVGPEPLGVKGGILAVGFSPGQRIPGAREPGEGENKEAQDLAGVGDSVVGGVEDEILEDCDCSSGEVNLSWDWRGVSGG